MKGGEGFLQGFLEMRPFFGGFWAFLVIFMLYDDLEKTHLSPERGDRGWGIKIN